MIEYIYMVVVPTEICWIEAEFKMRGVSGFTISEWLKLYTTGKNMDFLESTMETFVFGIVICWKWLNTNHKEVLWF